MLDAKIMKDAQGKLSFAVFRKATHTDHYLQFASNQPIQHKLGVIRTLYHRCNTICPDDDKKEQEISHLTTVLSVSGYTKSAWRTALRPKPPKVSRDPTTTVNITLPYVGTVTDTITRIMCKAGITVHLWPFNTLRNKLFHPKDKVEKLDRTGVVYHIKCPCCDSNYVGETERNVKKRLKEHQRSSSPVGHHMEFNTHSFSNDDVTILHQEPGWFRRGVAEAIHIQRQNPNLNRDRGRHNLPPIYREIIESCGFPSTKSHDHTGTLQ